MKPAAIVPTGVVLSFIAAVTLGAQSDTSADAHVARARAAAGQDYPGLADSLCTAPAARGNARQGGAGARQGGAGRGAGRGATPDRATWHVEPVKVFDNLYFVGQSEFSAWAVQTSAGIILVDAIFDYSVEEQVAGGLKKLGLNPADIKYVIISHGHGDHSGGAKFLQDTYGARVLLAAEDWDLLDRSTATRPKRDMVVTDGYKLTLGDTTLTIHKTPGHTLGTISTIIPVKDNGQPHLAAVWGGTAFNWMSGSPAYITPETPAAFWFKTYIQSANRFKDIVAKGGVDIILSNHTSWDGSKVKLPAVLARKPGEPHPYVLGNQRVQNYLTVASECAQAQLARLP